MCPLNSPLTFAGDHPAIDQNTNVSGMQVGYDNFNLIADYDQTEERQDILYGAVGNDLIQGATGTDYLDGQDGDDILEGGSGKDALFGGAGDDHLKGGDGDDILLGDRELENITNSYIYTNNELLVANQWQTTEGGVVSHHWQVSLNSYETTGGSDYIEGGAGNDEILAGAKDDYVDGGIGDDVVFGGILGT